MTTNCQIGHEKNRAQNCDSDIIFWRNATIRIMIPVNIIVIFNNIDGRDWTFIVVRGRSAIFVLIVTAVLMILTSTRAPSIVGDAFPFAVRRAQPGFCEG